ncbi:MAG TPA: glycerol acyltransferase [Alphaproteobacteria bacterium]|nr:glycerol acyltransferase [Alphaproteobacteria bacterium]HAJ48438.1 glycerol acyltransferase [Alphaproteobacteria bacterium]
MPQVDTFSYASPEDPLFRRLIIRMIEVMTGQPKLKRMYLENQAHPVPGESFWDAAVRHLRLTIDLNQEAIANIPKTGPCVIVANHPFGVLDGILICWLIARVRTDFKVLTNALLYRAEEVRPYLLPIDFEETKAALETNLKSRAESKKLLEDGGVLVVFPGGTVSTTKKPFGKRAEDPEWKTFTARMIIQGKAPVVPVFFAGQNSRLFQIASHVSMTLRLSLLFKEVHDRIGKPLSIRIGRRIPYEEIAAIKDRKELMDFLRSQTYALADQRERLSA